ncbi:permease [Leptolyngbya valderiana BDU 20041]|nr:sulfite exporter TauE/SafE family protein [Geitlerinema sp. CS-897]OAB60794.1 permease [Leptolyngbya valderiana BDU 20041]
MEVIAPSVLTWAIGHLLAVAIGLSLGLLGGGGSILAVPTLVYVMSLPTKLAVATSLFVVGLVSLVGLIPHWQQHHVNLKVAFIFAPFAIVGAYGGAQIVTLPFVTDTVQLLSFGTIMLVVSLLTIRKSDRSPSKTAIPTQSQRFDAATLPVVGVFTGVLTGFVGVGGGFAIVPALVLLGGVPMKEAIGTSLLLIAINSASGFLGYINQVDLDWPLTLSFTTAATLGTLVGGYLARAIDAKHLQKSFGYFVLAVAVFTLLNL